MKKIILSVFLVMIVVCSAASAFAAAPEITTDFGFATDFHAYGDEETVESKQWKYMYNTNKAENETGIYTNYKGYEEMTDWVDDAAGGYWNYAGGRIYNDGLIYSVNAARVAAVWIAPMSGTVRIKVNAGDFGRLSTFASELDTDADVVTRIARTNSEGVEAVELEEVVLPAEPEYFYKNNTLLPKELEIHVATGDRVYFECHGTGSVRREIIWKPTVQYTNAVQYYTDDGTRITSDTEIIAGMSINCAFYEPDWADYGIPMCLTLYDSKNRLSAATFQTVAKEDDIYTLSVTVPSLLTTPTEIETDFSKWSIGLTVVSDISVFKPIYVSDMLVFK